MKKICMITTVSVTLKSFVVDTAIHLHDNCGYDVTLICDKDEAFAHGLPQTIRYIPVPMSRGANFSSFSAIKRFAELFRRERFDLVQYATPNAACYASIAAAIAKVPVRLYCQWGIRYVGFTGFKRGIFKQIEKMTCLLSTDIRCASRLNKEFSIQEGLYKRDKADVVGEGGTIGVDMTVFDVSQKAEWSREVRHAYGLKDDDFVYGFVGRVTADKGCTELFRGFRDILADRKNVKLLVVGPMEKDCGLDDELFAWARDNENIILTGFVPKSQMQKYYTAMDVLVHPTYREGFGMVIQEAGALGIPVITTRIPGASEVMEDGVSCVLVEPKNVEELAMAMETLATDPQKTVELGRAALERTKQLYERGLRLKLQEQDYAKLLKDL